MRSREGGVGFLCVMLPLATIAGSLRVGPTRIDLSPRHPVAVVEVQNTGDSETLVQIDTLTWTQRAGEESLEPTTELLATPMILSLTPGETRPVRVGLREPIVATVERSYRLIVGEVAPTAVGQNGLRFAVRISIPVFAQAPEPGHARAQAPEALSWIARPGLPGCNHILLTNTSSRHEHLLRAQLLAQNGAVLWQSAGPDYILAESQHSLNPQVCAPPLPGAGSLLLSMDGRTITLPPAAAGLLVDAK